MQEDRQHTDLQNEGRERRIAHRLDTAVAATVSFLVRDLEIEGQLENLSVNGARFTAAVPCPRGAGHLVEIRFNLDGCAFRLTSVVQWNDGSRLGLHFEPLPERRRQELNEALVLESIRKGAVQEGEPDESTWTESPVPEVDPTPVLEQPEVASRGEGWRERRAHPRVKTEMPAAIYLVTSNIKLNGWVRDLSLGGCRIHTDQVVHAGIYTRVEAGFYHMGMPFRVAGVLQAIHGSNEVGIRFLDVSERTGGKLADLMLELKGLA